MAKTFPATAMQDEPLDALCWRILGQTEKVVEQTLELNPGLADQGPLLREGQVINLPVIAPPVVPQRPLVQLWD